MSFHHHRTSTELFLFFKTKTVYLLTNNSSVPPPSPNTKESLFYFSVCILTTRGISYKWNFIFVLLCLTYFTGHNILKLHPGCNVSELPSFLKLNNIPLHVYTAFCLSIHLLMGTWVSSALIIANNAAGNIGIQVSFQDLDFNYFWVYAQKWNC